MPELVGAGVSGSVIRQPSVSVDIITKDAESGSTVLGSPPNEVVLNYFDTVIADSPIWYTRLGHTSGNTAFDEVGSLDSIEKVNDPILGQDGLINDADKSIHFEFNDSYSFGSPSILSFTNGSNDLPFSFEAWVNIKDTSAHPIVSKSYKIATSTEYLFIVQPTGEVVLHLFDTVTGNRRTGSTATGLITVAGGTYHMGVSYDGTVNSIIIYINGVAVATTQSGGGSYTRMIDNANNSFRIADYNPGELTPTRVFANAHMDEIAAYDKVLTPTQFLAHYNAGI